LYGGNKIVFFQYFPRSLVTVVKKVIKVSSFMGSRETIQAYVSEKPYIRITMIFLLHKGIRKIVTIRGPWNKVHGHWQGYYTMRRPPAAQRRRPRSGVRSQARRHLPLPPRGGRC
jgi:hypothetical protein